jgi:hypothetical protein
MHGKPRAASVVCTQVQRLFPNGSFRTALSERLFHTALSTGSCSTGSCSNGSCSNGSFQRLFPTALSLSVCLHPAGHALGARPPRLPRDIDAHGAAGALTALSNGSLTAPQVLSRAPLARLSHGSLSRLSLAALSRGSLARLSRASRAPLSRLSLTALSRLSHGSLSDRLSLTALSDGSLSIR